MILRKLTYIFIFSSLLYSCKKTDSCPGTSTIQVVANQTTITKGWDLNLSVNSPNAVYDYHWSGPNGWALINKGQPVKRDNLEISDAGKYSVTVYDGNNCPIKQGDVNIQVVDPVTAPCDQNIVNNSCQSDYPTIGNFNCNYVLTFYPINQVLLQGLVNNNGTGPYVQVTFYGQSKPIPGIYKTTPPFGQPYEGQAQVLIADNTLQGVGLISGQDVYVTLVNGKTQVSICNSSLTSPFLSFHFSAKLTMD